MDKVIHQRFKSKFFIHTEDIICAFSALLLGCAISPYAFMFTMIYTMYSLMRDAREASIVIFFSLLCALNRGIIDAYIYALGFTIMLCCVQIVKLRNNNLYKAAPYIVLIICFAYSLFTFKIHPNTLVITLGAWSLMYYLFKEYQWVKKKMMLDPVMKTILIFSSALLLSQMMPAYQNEFIMIGCLLLAFVAQHSLIAILLFLAYWMFQIQDVEYIIFFYLISQFKQEKRILFSVLLIASFILPQNNTSYLYLMLALCGALLCLFTNQQKSENKILNLASDHLLKRQMSNYASIFQLLSDYYAQQNDIQSSLLENMASALQYHADILGKQEGVQKDVQQIQTILEGYQYQVQSVELNEFHEGNLQIQMQLANIKGSEIQANLLPLMEALMHRRLKVAAMNRKHMISKTYELTLQDYIPFHVDAYADSLKNSYTSSGDIFSIFRFRQNVVCMISDGMGNGERANRSARLIASIFQRMMIAGIQQDHAIRCINKLVQSDTFATLDVICFHRSKGVAYISKSAACPTFLLREEEVYEINGSALPLGIVSQIQPDCFQVKLKANDEFLMMSDGVYMHEVYEWIKKRKVESVKGDLETFMEILSRARRKDDSTLILAKVYE